MVWLNLTMLFLHPVIFQLLWIKHPDWQKSCVLKFSVLHVHSYPIPVYFLSLHCWNPQIQTSPYRITSLTDSCQRKPCVVCPAPVVPSSTPAQLLQRQKGPAQQGSALQIVFRRLRSSSPPPAATTTALPSSTEQMTLRTTWVRKRGHTLPCLLRLCIA